MIVGRCKVWTIQRVRQNSTGLFWARASFKLLSCSQYLTKLITGYAVAAHNRSHPQQSHEIHITLSGFRLIYEHVWGALPSVDHVLWRTMFIIDNPLFISCKYILEKRLFLVNFTELIAYDQVHLCQLALISMVDISISLEMSFNSYICISIGRWFISGSKDHEL